MVAFYVCVDTNRSFTGKEHCVALVPWTSVKHNIKRYLNNKSEAWALFGAQCKCNALSVISFRDEVDLGSAC